MPALFIFLIKVNIALLLFCAGYYLVLRHLTFYTINRVYLVVAILFASVYPEINLSDFASKHAKLAQPVQAAFYDWQTPAQNLITPISRPNYWFWLELVFWAGVILLTLRLLGQLYSLYRLYKSSHPQQVNNYRVRVTPGDVTPFSFWRSIYLNPANHTSCDLKAILMHEQVHISQWHTLDILLAELSTIFYWFNPGIWLIARAIRENIEFITDRKILNTGLDCKQYQYSLVKVSFAASSYAIVNHFNISTIKKRIIMMNAKRSSKLKLTRYALLVPALILLLLVFTLSKAAFIKKNKIDKVFTGLVMNENGNKQVKTTAQSVLLATTLKTSLLAKSAVLRPVTPKAGDTVRNGGLVAVTSEASDSLSYVINGVKATKTDFRAIDPDRIVSIAIISGAKAKTIMDQIDPKHNVLFVTTNDSEAGKKFKEKIDGINWGANDKKTFRGTPMASSTTVNGYNVSSDDNVYLSYSVNGTDTIRIKGKNIRLAKPSKVTYHLYNDSSVRFIRRQDGNYSKTIVISKGDSDIARVLKLRKLSGTIVSDTMINRQYKLNSVAIAGNQFFIRGLAKRGNDETSINHLTAKLIIIDGKEASEKDLKKISANDIENLRVQSGEEVLKKYGQKAKDGVVFITTKKKG